MTDRKSPGQANRAALWHHFLLLETVVDDWQQLTGTCMSPRSTRKKKPPRVATYFGICKNMFPPRRLCFCLGNTLLKLLTDSIDLHAGAKVFCLKSAMRNNVSSHVFLSVQQHWLLSECTARCLKWLILDSADKKWALTTVTFHYGLWQALSTIQGHLKWCLFMV